MIRTVCCTALSVALAQLGNYVKEGEASRKNTVIFCEDRLSLAAEQTVCAAVGGTFSTSVFTFARFLASECGKSGNVLSAQGSAMAVRRIIEENRGKLTLFRKLSSPQAAQSVYDTIALLFSSRVSAEDLAAASAEGLLGGKLADLALIYGEYMKYLGENGLEDRNGYLRKLGPVIEGSPKIRGANVIFLGFQAFTRTAEDCLRAAFCAAGNVTGIFISGDGDIYVNEASETFGAVAAEYGGSVKTHAFGAALPEAETLRKSVFDPESFYRTPQKTSRVKIFEAGDEEEELEFIAACIKKHVIDGGERYSKISVMLPDLDGCVKSLERVFGAYRIPFYADRRIPLSEHPLCAFLLSFLSCLISGCRPQDVDAAIASPFFPAARADKDVFRNYALRFANYRGGIRREPDPALLEKFDFDGGAVQRVRAAFSKCLSALSAKGDERGVFGGLFRLLEVCGAREKLAKTYEKYRDDYPATAAFGARALDGVEAVLREAEGLSAGLSLKDVSKVLKSGFAAMKISLIPPKADAVFVGDLGATANKGSNVVFAARLSGDVPGSDSDSALLTDREIAALERANLSVSPKIRQVNLRKRETAALNLCAFKENLYLSYPARINGEESAPSEIIAYAQAIFLSPSGGKLAVADMRRLERSGKHIAYYASEKAPALKRLAGRRYEAGRAEIYAVLSQKGFKEEADEVLRSKKYGGLKNARSLYLNYDSLSPTALETYFLCPWLGFMRQGLRVQEREEGAVRPVDSGNFIHAVLEELAQSANSAADAEEFRRAAEAAAEAKLKTPPYSSLAAVKSGEYAAEALKAEAVKVAEAMFAQLRNSRFRISEAEGACRINIGGVSLYGRTDRVDVCGDMVRIIDYKTGTIDGSPTSYYMGSKLQLPLYLLAVSGDRRAVGAYYFPASVEYRESGEGAFRLQGYMDGSEEVVTASDVNVRPKQKSEYFDAYLNGRKVDAAMDPEEFSYFIAYSGLVAGRGAEEMLSGNVTPSPAHDACKYCKMGGSCNFAVGRDGEERQSPSVKCSDIARIAKGGD